MTISNKPAFLIKVSDGAEPPSYTTIAGMHQFERDDGAIEGIGVFTGIKALEILTAAAASGGPDAYELSFASGERLRGTFLVMQVALAGERGDEMLYRVVMSEVKS